MKTATAKKEIVSVMAHRFGHVFEPRKKITAEVLPTGVAEIDSEFHGFPRGAITEIHGAASSGRTSLMLSSLAFAASQEETCALIDGSDTFDLSSAAGAGVNFDRLLWVRCSHNLERAFKAVDLLLHAGGFGFIALNLSDVPAKAARRIISSWWFRFRRALENTPTVLIVITPIACVRSCAALVLELKNEAAVWPSTLSLVSENHDVKLTEKEPSAPRLSLVAIPHSRLVRGSQPSHAHLIQGLHIRIDQKRPAQWSAVTFNTRRH
jgi:hypothetical protein